MMDANRIAEANRLYWETDTSVADIADRFDLSRRALYDAIRPLPTGQDCPACGQVLQYENRSARRDAQASCAECGTQAAIGDLDDPAPDSMTDATGGSDPRTDARAVADPDDARATHRRGRAVWLGGAVIAGVAVGAVTALLARRRG